MIKKIVNLVKTKGFSEIDEIKIKIAISNPPVNEKKRIILLQKRSRIRMETSMK
jgi:ABC-type metal ion transport system substrate-binding protein